MLSVIQNINSYLEGSWRGLLVSLPPSPHLVDQELEGNITFFFLKKKGIFLIKFVSINWLNVLCIVKSII